MPCEIVQRGVCTATVVTGSFTGSTGTVNVTADVFFPDVTVTPMNGMSVVGVHGGWCRGTTGSWTSVANHLAANGWVVIIPNYRGDWNTDRAIQCPPAPNACDVGCTELQDIRNAACFLKSRFNTCSNLCSGGGCLDPDLVFGWGHSAGGNRVVMTEVRYPETFKRIAATGGGLDGRFQYEKLADCGGLPQGWKEVVELILEADDGQVTDQDFLERDAIRNVAAITPDCPGQPSYLTGFIGFAGYRDRAVTVENLDHFLDALDDSQTQVIREDPQSAVNSQKHVYCETQHNWWKSGTLHFHSRRALETVNAITRFFKDEKGATNPERRRRQPIKVYQEPPIPEFHSDGGQPMRFRYTFKAWICNTGYDAALEVDVEHRIFPLRQNCEKDPGAANPKLQLPTEICGIEGTECPDGPSCNSLSTNTGCFPCPGIRLEDQNDPTNYWCVPLLDGWKLNKDVPAGTCIEVSKTRDLTDSLSTLDPDMFPLPIRHDVTVRVDHDENDPQPPSKLCPPDPDCHQGVPDEIYDPTMITGGVCSTPDKPVCEILGRFSERFVLTRDMDFLIDPDALAEAEPNF